MKKLAIVLLALAIALSLAACAEQSPASTTSKNSNSTGKSNQTSSNKDSSATSDPSGTSLDSYLATVLEAGQFDDSITYDQLARTPETYIGTPVFLTGKIVQIMKGDDFTAFRLAIGADYSKIIYVESYPGYPIDRAILEDDYVALSGVSYGEFTYEAVMGNSVTLPVVLAVKMEITEVPLPPLPDYPAGPLTLKNYYSSGKLWSTTEIESFNITTAEISYSGELHITCEIIGTVKGNNTFHVNLNCYDEEGFLLDSASLYSSVSDGERFRVTESAYIPADTYEIRITVD